MSVEESPEQESPAAVKGPSELLTEARERLGLSQKDVADKLYLTTTFIKCIDDGEFSGIPKPAFIKGYLRTYARVVELSGDEIVALYEAELQAAEPTPEMRGVTEENVGTASITGPVLQTGLIGLGGLALVILVIWWIVSDPEEETPPSVTQPGISQPATQNAPKVDFDFVQPPQEDTVLQLEQVSAEQAVPEQTVPRQTVPEQRGSVLQIEMTETLGTIDAVEPANAETVAENEEESAIRVAEQTITESFPEEPARGERNPGAVSASVKFERATDGTRSFVTVDASGFDQLELSFRDECWVEIEDSQFGLIYNDLNRANDVLTIYGTAPFNLLLGKATGVEMIYNGRPFELEPFVSSDRTAKLTVSD